MSENPGDKEAMKELRRKLGAIGGMTLDELEAVDLTAVTSQQRVAIKEALTRMLNRF